MMNDVTVESVESTENNQTTQEVKSENEELKNLIKSLETKIELQQKTIDETNNKFKSFVSDYMNKKHEEITKEAQKVVLDDNDPSYEF